MCVCVCRAQWLLNPSVCVHVCVCVFSLCRDCVVWFRSAALSRGVCLLLGINVLFILPSFFYDNFEILINSNKKMHNIYPLFTLIVWPPGSYLAGQVDLSVTELFKQRVLILKH